VRSSGEIAFRPRLGQILSRLRICPEHTRNRGFPRASGSLATELGVGAALHDLPWPAVEGPMAELGLSMTANQNSIRASSDAVTVMLEGKSRGPFPFNGS